MKKVNGVLNRIQDKDIVLLKNDPDKFWEGVTAIGDEAFCYILDLTEIVIPDTVTKIGEFAFENCLNLTKVHIPDSVTSIGAEAFSYCSKLTDIRLPGGLAKIGNSTFSYCQALSKIKIPKSVTSIGNMAFQNCINLTDVNIPDGVTRISNMAFQRCSSLKKVEIPEGVTNISEMTFVHCADLTEVVLPSNLKKIDSMAFYKCTSLKSVNIPEGVTKVGNMSFSGCANLTRVGIPETLKSIGEMAFSHCVNLEEIKLPKSIKTIGYNAFQDCSELNELKIDDVKIENAFLIDKFEGLIKSPQFYQKYLENYIPPVVVDALKEDGNLELMQNLKNYSKNIYKKYIKDSTQIDERSYVHKDLVTLCLNLGIFSNEKMKLKSNGSKKDVEDLISNQGYNIIQKLFKKIEPKDLHIHMQALYPDSPNEELIRFLSNKTNLDNVIQEEQSSPGFITRAILWFNSRRSMTIANSNAGATPNSEENRYKVLVYETTPSGIDKLKWHEPTVENLKKEFANRKFSGVTQQNASLAGELAKHDLYQQRHFDKAQEIDNERIVAGVGEHITKTPVKQTIDEAWRAYFEKTEQQRNEIVNAVAKTTKEQGEIADRLFTYEMISKSSPANFCMGFYTSCCATLYGAGSGAQRAMIVSPNMQPLVIRDSRGDIIAFGIVYVNRKEGYAVVNDFEVNKKYNGREDAIEAIYRKAMEGVRSFAKQYNLEQEDAVKNGDKDAKKIKIVNCGISPNWTAINEFVKNNPKSEILSAPNFSEFGYAGDSGRWPGDWHKEQYTIWKEDGEGQVE